MSKLAEHTTQARTPTPLAAAELAARAIPPLWPLASSVAVNPFLGQAGESLAVTAARLARVAGIPVTMPRSWYLERMSSGEIRDDDLAGALAAAPAVFRPASLAELKILAQQVATPLRALPTVADLAAEVSGIDWPGLIADRVSVWASGYFDEGQALWAAPRPKGAYSAWRAVAIHDLTPEIVGLRGFAAFVADAPERAHEALVAAIQHLLLGPEALETYFHQLLMTLGGWSQFARYRVWESELGGRRDETLIELLTIRVLWEHALHLRYAEQIRARWQGVRGAHAEAVVPTAAFWVDAILQEAAERAAQRRLAHTLARPPQRLPGTQPVLQAAFCIDVRSEVVRRALESLDPGIQTLGFAGFFGLGVSHRRFASDASERRLPVLLKPGLSSRSGAAEDAARDHQMRITARAIRAWGRFKLAAVSSFAFVEATGPLYVAKLLRDTLALHDPVPDVEPPPQFDPAVDLESRTSIAEAVLRAMSLTQGFSRLVLLVGHGATVVNNPHASALQCGACGGYSGEVNARLLAGVLNDAAVRARLASRGIEIPVDTLFLGALHDTTTDGFTLYAADRPSRDHQAAIEQARAWLADAGRLTRAERAVRLPGAQGERSVLRRSRDWAEVRPEWALAGCQSFIAAPRSRTAGRSFEGRAFLHDYDWRRDTGFPVLELILTAPVVVASWISLQYYGSTVAPQAFGAGNKLLHNVTGGIGVVEGNGGLLRGGLPWQSVNDGQHAVHEPLRLAVCIEAPCEAIAGVLERHAGVRALFDHRWLHLFALDDQGQMAWRYAGDLKWTPMDAIDVAGAARPFRIAV